MVKPYPAKFKCDEMFDTTKLHSGENRMYRVGPTPILVLVLALMLLSMPLLGSTPDEQEDVPVTDDGETRSGDSVGPAADSTSPVFRLIGKNKYLTYSPQYPGPTTWVNVSANIYDASMPVNVDIKRSGDNSTWQNVSSQDVTMPAKGYTDRNPNSGTNTYYVYGYTYMPTGGYSYLNNLSVYYYTSDGQGIYTYVNGYRSSPYLYKRIFTLSSSTAKNGWLLNTNVGEYDFDRIYVYFRDYNNRSAKVYYQVKYDMAYERSFQITPAGQNSTNYLKFTVTDTADNSMVRYYNYSIDLVSPTVVDMTTYSGIVRSPTPLSVYANVTDNRYIERCRLAWSTDNATWNHVEMDKISGSLTAAQFRGFIPLPSANTTIYYKVKGIDMGSSVGQSPVVFFVWDPPPRVTDVTATPVIINGTGSSTITASITDDDSISSVSLMYRVGPSGTENQVAMAQGIGDSWSASIGNFGVTANVYYHVTVFDANVVPFSSPDHVLFVDADPPAIADHYIDPEYPNCTEETTVHLELVDNLSPTELWVDHKVGWTGTVQTTDLGTGGQRLYTDRNPSTGYTASTLGRYYYAPSDSVFGRVLLSVHSWDHSGLYVRVIGYRSGGGSSYIRYTTSATDGIVVDTNVTDSDFYRLYVNIYDMDGSPVYYDLTYTTINKDFSITVPGPGYSIWVWYRVRGTDSLHNSDTSQWYRYWADGTIPVLDSHRSPGLKPAKDDVQVVAVFKDEHAIQKAQLFYNHGTDVDHQINMSAFSKNMTRLEVTAIVPKTRIPLTVTYYFRVFDEAGNNFTTRNFTFRTQMDDLTEGVYEDFDSSVIVGKPGIIKWQWDFVYDGTFNQDYGGQKARYRYYDNGTYTAVLRITLSDFTVIDFNFTLVALDAGPTADIANPGQVEEGDLVALDASGSISWPDEIVLYEWDLEYDGTTFDSDATGVVHNITFMSNDIYTVALRVTDDDGSIDLVSRSIDVGDVRPTIVLDYLTTVDEGVQMTLNASATTAWPDALDRIEWDLDYDGTFVKQTAGLIINHTYMDDGEYQIALRAYDNDGSMTQIVRRVTVLDLTPVANITGPAQVSEGVPIDLDASGSISFPDAIVSYKWDLHYDGNFVEETSGVRITYTYMDQGAYTMALLIEDDDGSTAMATWEVEVKDAVPRGSINTTLTVDEGVPMKISTDATSYPDDIVSIEWDFYYNGVRFDQDANGRDVTHTYMDDGNYSIALRVTDEDGSVLMDFADIVVLDLAPVAKGTVSAEFVEGGTLILDARPSTSYPDTMETYAWDLDYDGETFTADMYGDLGEHVYYDDGTYTIVLLVTDDDGSQDMTQWTFDIVDLGPTAVITVNVLFHSEGSLVTFSAGGSISSPDELVANHWDWDGDGEIDETTSEANGRHTFTKPGRYTVVLTVEDDDGTTDSTSVTVTITDVGPTARLEAVPTPEGKPVLLDGSGTTEPGSDFVAFRWDLDGDMEWDVEGTEPTLEHTWYEPGMYDISMEVEDEDGSTSVKGITLIVQDVVPTADAGGPYEVEEGTPLILDATGSDEPGRNLTAFRWDVDGDGGFDGEGEELEWTFTLAGEYTISLQVEDADESSSETTTTVVVLDRDPEFTISLPENVTETVSANFSLVDLFDPGTTKFRVTWYFGDGSTARGVSVKHTYVEDGTYEGKVEVQDNEGTVVIRIWPRALEVGNIPPVVELSTRILVATEDSEFTLSVFGQDTANDTVTYDFKGPGGKIDEQTGLFKWTPLDEHVGKNKFTFIARDEDGGEGTLEVKIDVEDVDNDFFGQPFATGMGIVIAIIVAVVIAVLLVARMRKRAAEDDVIEPEEKLDLKAPVEVELDGSVKTDVVTTPKPGPKRDKAPPRKRPPEGRPPPKKRPPGQRPPPKQRPPGAPPPRQRPPGQRPPPKQRPPGAPPPRQRPPGQRPPPKQRPPGAPPPRRRPPPGQRPPPKKKRPPAP